MQSVEVFVGGYGILPYPRHPLKSSHRFHRIHRSFWRRIFSHGFHRIHRSFWRRIFSHRFHRIHRSFWRRVFSHGFHGFPQMVRLCYWRRGYGRMPYPPNQCASVSICGRHFSARMFCVFRVFCGTLSLFALLVHLWAAYLRWFPSAARSDSVRHPIRFRSPSNQIASATRSGSVRCTMP